MFDASPAANESEVQTQKLLSHPVRIVEKYPAGEGGELKKKHMVCLNWLLSDKPLDLETKLTLGFWDHLMLGFPASPQRKISLESVLGNAIVGGETEDELLQPQFSIGLKGGSEDDIQGLIMSSLKKIAEEGFDTEKISIGIYEYYFFSETTTLDHFPCGLCLMLRSIGKWIYDMDPFEPLKHEEPLMALKARTANEGSKVFSPLIEKFILNNLRILLLLKCSYANLQSHNASVLDMSYCDEHCLFQPHP